MPHIPASACRSRAAASRNSFAQPVGSREANRPREARRIAGLLASRPQPGRPSLAATLNIYAHLFDEAASRRDLGGGGAAFATAPPDDMLCRLRRCHLTQRPRVPNREVANVGSPRAIHPPPLSTSTRTCPARPRPDRTPQAGRRHSSTLPRASTPEAPLAPRPSDRTNHKRQKPHSKTETGFLTPTRNGQLATTLFRTMHRWPDVFSRPVA